MDQVIASFGRSIPKTLGLLVLGVLMTGLGGALALGYIGPVSLYKTAVGWIAAIFFGLCTLGILVQLLRAGPAVEVSTAGIRYYRRSADLIPWAAIAAMSVQVMKRQKFLVLELFPEAAAQLEASRSARILEKANAALGFSGVWISMTGLDGSLDELIEAIELAHGGALGARHD
jgi:hypothetical protein